MNKPVLIGEAAIISQPKRDLTKLQLAIEQHLDHIQRILGADYKLTLIANHAHHQDTSADLVLTLGTRERVMQAVEQFVPLANDPREPEPPQTFGR